MLDAWAGNSADQPMRPKDRCCWAHKTNLEPQLLALQTGLTAHRSGERLCSQCKIRQEARSEAERDFTVGPRARLSAYASADRAGDGEHQRRVGYEAHATAKYWQDPSLYFIGDCARRLTQVGALKVTQPPESMANSLPELKAISAAVDGYHFSQEQK